MWAERPHRSYESSQLLNTPPVDAEGLQQLPPPHPLPISPVLPCTVPTWTANQPLLRQCYDPSHNNWYQTRGKANGRQYGSNPHPNELHCRNRYCHHYLNYHHLSNLNIIQVISFQPVHFCESADDFKQVQRKQLQSKSNFCSCACNTSEERHFTGKYVGNSNGVGKPLTVAERAIFVSCNDITASFFLEMNDIWNIHNMNIRHFS